LQGLVSANSLITPEEAAFLTSKSTADKFKVTTSAAFAKGKSKHAFSVDRGLRQRMVPVLDKSGKQITVDGKPAWKEQDTESSEYVTKLEDIATHIFSDKFESADLPKLWSAVGLIELMEKYSSEHQIQLTFDKVIDNMFGKGAQHINQTPEEDQKVKLAAWVMLTEAFPFIDQTEAKQMFKDYYAGFEDRQAAMLKRKGVE
jgi:hypothetical protein